MSDSGTSFNDSSCMQQRPTPQKVKKKRRKKSAAVGSNNQVDSTINAADTSEADGKLAENNTIEGGGAAVGGSKRRSYKTDLKPGSAKGNRKNSSPSVAASKKGNEKSQKYKNKDGYQKKNVEPLDLSDITGLSGIDVAKKETSFQQEPQVLITNLNASKITPSFTKSRRLQKKDEKSISHTEFSEP
ncbi:uncharacterized protein LOC134856430, partial [Symsagittifera roscoffensis]|uniref:uncharacterized protein LOC134856430 n=1 Tax=Symsagittifera roscoffensis TaxID=84072 RepID=UPI00307C433D